MFDTISKSLAAAGLSVLVLSVLVLTTPAHALTDPTQPSQYRAATPRSNLNLESILFSPERRVAVINGRALAEGETINGARVLSIGKDTVRVQQSGKTLSLTLQRPTIRQEK